LSLGLNRKWQDFDNASALWFFFFFGSFLFSLYQHKEKEMNKQKNNLAQYITMPFIKP